MQQIENQNLVIESNFSDVKNKLYPVFLKLENMHTLVVGAGFIGLEKLNSLLNNCPNAKITIVADKVSNEVREFAGQFEHTEIIERYFEADDLDGKDLVIAATGNMAVNEIIRCEAGKRKLLVNVADTPALCDFYLGSIVQKGDLKIAISTNGKSPTAAKRIREFLDESITDEFDDTLENLQAIRQQLKGNFAEKVKKLNQVTDIHSGMMLRKEKGDQWKRIASFSLLIFGSMLIGYFLFSYMNMA
ncbi:MAG: precorrin-2 dehydrogenase/sirohydrochlorin ferrochelatase family protein, partial [Chitinophagaceae bacterium]